MMGEKVLNLMFLPLMVLAFSPFHGVARGRTQTFTSKAFDGSGTLSYIEEHDIPCEGKVVIKTRITYSDPDKRIIGSIPTIPLDLSFSAISLATSESTMKTVSGSRRSECVCFVKSLQGRKKRLDAFLGNKNGSSFRP